MKSRLALAISCLCVSVSAHAVGVSGQGTWETTLQARDLDGNLTTAEAYYDTALGITWLANANAGAGTIYDDFGLDLGGPQAVADGRMTWINAKAWAGSLNINGITGWRLPKVVDVGDPGCTYELYSGIECGYNIDTSTGEMAHMFYSTLGNWGLNDPVCCTSTYGFGLSNTGPFSNIQAFVNWADMEYAPEIGTAWYFDFNFGDQYRYDIDNAFYAWAVHDGDVGTALPTSAVPLPASVWLLGSGLLGLLGIIRKNAAQFTQWSV